jgi:hypothetical protein
MTKKKIRASRKANQAFQEKSSIALGVYEIVQRDTGETTSGDPEDTKEQLSNMVKQWQR